jgi:hypothetical protein
VLRKNRRFPRAEVKLTTKCADNTDTDVIAGGVVGRDRWARRAGFAPKVFVCRGGQAEQAIFNVASHFRVTSH